MAHEPVAEMGRPQRVDVPEALGRFFWKNLEIHIGPGCDGQEAGLKR